MTHPLLEQVAQFDTAAISDALDKLGLPSGVGGLNAYTLETPIIGFAKTAVLEPREEGAQGAHIMTGVVDDSGQDDVIVIDNGGRTDVSSWGGILGLGAISRGVQGVIIDGAFRDVEENRKMGLPIYAKGTTPMTARGRLQQRSAGEPARIVGRTVREGDIVYADATGFVVVPSAHIEQVLLEAAAIATREAAIVKEIQAGSSLHDSMRDARLAGTEEGK